MCRTFGEMDSRFRGSDGGFCGVWGQAVAGGLFARTFAGQGQNEAHADCDADGGGAAV